MRRFPGARRAASFPVFPPSGGPSVAPQGWPRPEAGPRFLTGFPAVFLPFFAKTPPGSEEGRPEGFHSRGIVAKVASKVAERIPRKSQDLRGHFHSRYSRWSKSMGYFASSASMILSASAPYTSSRYLRRSSSGSLGSPRGFSGRRTTSCWSA